jgi:CBS domain-containing protein
MQVKDIMCKDCQYIHPDTSLKDAAKLMRDLDVGFLPVEENDRLVGVVTDRDIVIRGLAGGLDGDVKNAMSSGCLYCHEDDSIEDLSTNMAKNKVRRLPVMNKDKRLVGVVSLGDLSFKGSQQVAGEALAAVAKH